MPPERLVFRTEKGTTIRGRVLDESEQPVAGATVVVSVRKKYPQVKQAVAISYQSTKTDADPLVLRQRAPAAGFD
jgi:hypothetical protein